MTNRSHRKPTALNRKLISFAVASCFATDLALANPVGPAVVSGAASFATTGRTLTVTNSPNAIINWQGFSIGAGEVTRFQQQSAASAVLNRVVGQDPSAILGTLSSNGRVYLVNPNGILFGQGSRVDVAGLVATTLNLSNNDFLAGRLNFEAGTTTGSLINQGDIVTGSGGRVLLIAPDVQNHGLISSPQGEVVLAAGKSVQLVEADLPMLKVEVSSGGEALNVGQIISEGGKIGVYAGLINQRGVVRADSASVDASGRIVFKSSDTTLLDGGSVTSAAGTKGGEVQVLGNKVGLLGNAQVDASGDAGGGTVLVGGDFQGKNAEVPNAYRTYFGTDASIKTDAVTTGNGGKVIVWSDDATRAYGTISARGGAQGGNGGLVEVSGKKFLDYGAVVDTRAPNGSAGTLLLDPTTIYIALNQANATTAGMVGTDTSIDADATLPELFAGPVAQSLLTTGKLTTALATSNVTVATQVPGDTLVGGGLGDILVVDPVSWSSGQSLTLLAQRNVSVNAAVTNAGAGNISMYAGWNAASTGSPVTPNTGSVFVSRNVQTGGALRFQAGSGLGSTVNINPGNTDLLVSAGGSLNIAGAGAQIRSGFGEKVSITAGGTFDVQVGGAFTFTGASVDGVHVSNPGTVDSSLTIQANAVSVNAGGNITIGAGEALVRAVSGVTATAIADATINATTSISLTGADVLIRGGDVTGAKANFATVQANTGVNSATASANTSLTAGTGITISGTNITIRGGDNARAEANYNGLGVAGTNTGTANANANATLTAGGDIILNATTAAIVRGGDSGVAQTLSNGDNSGAGTGSATLNAGATVTSTAGALTVTAANLTVRGGDNALASASSNGTPPGTGSGIATTSFNAMLSAGTTLTLGTVLSPLGGLTVRGGNSASASASSSGYNTAVVNANADAVGNSVVLNVNGAVTIAGGADANADAMRGHVAPAGLNSATVNANAKIHAVNNLSLAVNGGSVLVAGGDNASASGSEAIGVHRYAANVDGTLSAGGSMTIGITGGGLTVRGGNGASAYASASGSPAADLQGSVSTKGKISAGGNLGITVSGAVSIQGGSNASAWGSGRTASDQTVLGVAADATVQAGGALTITAGSVTVRGGDNASAQASSSGRVTSTVTTSALVSAGGTLTVNSSGAMTVRGGNNAFASASGSSVGAQIVATTTATAGLSAGGLLTINAGSLTLTGGVQGASDMARVFAPGTNSATTTTNASIIGSSGFDYTGGAVLVQGGFARSQGAAGSAATSRANSLLQIAGTTNLNATGNFDLVGGSALDNVSFSGGLSEAKGTLALGSASLNSSGTLSLGAVSGIVSGNSSVVTAVTASDSMGIRADSMEIATTLDATNAVTLAPFTISRQINIESSPTGGVLSVTPTEIGNVTAAALEIGRSDGNATMIVSAPFDMSSYGTLTLRHGNINLSNSITKTAGADATLKLIANNEILVQGGADITSSSNKLNITLHADADASGVGRIALNAGTVLTSNGGTVTLGGGADPLTGFAVGTTGAGTRVGVSLTGATISAGAGNVSIRGQGAVGTTLAHGVALTSGAVVETTTGAINIVGAGGNGTGTPGGWNLGVQIWDAGTRVSSAGGNITLTGTGGSSTGTDTVGGSDDGRNRGIWIDNADIQTTGSGNIMLTGTGGTASAWGANSGILVGGADASITAVDGTITLTGTAGGNFGAGATVGANRGVSLNALLQTTGAGSINITGTGGTGASSADATNSGVLVQGDQNNLYQASIWTDGSGSISITGNAHATGGTGEGLLVSHYSSIQARGTGSVALNGNKGSGAYDAISFVNGQIHVTTSSGTLTLDAIGDVTLAAETGEMNVYGAGGQTTNVSGLLGITGGTGANQYARIASGGTQVVNAGSIVLTGGATGTGNAAQLNSGGDQTISATGITLVGGAGGGGSGVGNSATISSNANQNITVGNGGLTLTGGGGALTDNSAMVLLSNANHAILGLDQTITVNGGGSIVMTGGSSAGTSVGAGHGSRALLYSEGDTQTISFTAGGSIALTGGTVGSRNFAHIYAPFGTQTISATGVAPNISLTGGASGGINGEGNTARIISDIGQSITANTITIKGGAGGSENFAGLGMANTAGTQLIQAAGITLEGGARSAPGAVAGGLDVGNAAEIVSNGNQQIGVGAGGLSIFGGGGTLTDNRATVFQGNSSGTAVPGTFQSIEVSGGGAITLVGGSSALSGVQASTPPPHHGSFASIRGDGDSQSISFAAGGSINLTGGTVGSNNYAIVRAAYGSQTITGAPNISLSGGANGGVDGEGNYAMILANQGLQDISAGDIALAAGAGGTNNFAVVQAPQQVIDALGNVTITGGGSAANADGTIGGGARIGGLGGTTPTTTDLVLSVAGSVTLTGGSVSGSAIGSGTGGGQTTDIVMDVGGNLTLNPGTAADAGSRIGSPSTAVAGGDITILAGGTIALNSSGGLGTAIRTAGNVILDADSITQGTGSELHAGGLAVLSTVSGAFLSGTSTLNTVALAAGDVTLSGTLSAGALSIPSGITLSGTGTVVGDVSNSGTISPGSSAGILTISGNYAQTSTGVLNVEIGGTTAGTEYDRLAVSGTATLGGTLNVLEGLVAPVAGTTYTVITCGSCTGTFTTVNAPTVNATPTYAATSFSLPFTAFLNSFSGGVSAAWEDPANWSRGTVPTSGDDVVVPGATTVTVSSGAQTAHSIVVNDGLILSGGSLNLAAPSTVGGTFTLSGGTLTGTGTLAVNQLVWTAGTIGSGGALTVGSGGATLTNSSAVILDGRSMTVNGPFLMAGTNWLDMYNGAVLTVNGLATLNTSNLSSSFFGINTFGAPATVNYAGGITKTGALPFDQVATANTQGTVQSLQGELVFDTAGGGTHAGTSFVAASGATIKIANGAHLASGNVTFGGAGVTQLGNNDGVRTMSFVPSGGTLTNNGTLNVVPGATLGALTNQGTLNLTSVPVSGLLTNTGAVNVDGSVSASGGIQQNGGLITVPLGQTLGVGGSGLVLAGGTLSGNGTISGNVNNQAGTVAPGASPGTLTVVGDYTQGASGVLAVEVGGTVAGSEYDQLKVIGNVFLDGNLNTTLFGSYTPLPGDSYTFIDATGTITGTFANISQPASLLPPVAGVSSVTGTGQVTVSVVSPSVPPAIEPSYNYTVVATETSGEPVENILIPVLGVEGTAGTEESTLEKKPPACS